MTSSAASSKTPAAAAIPSSLTLRYGGDRLEGRVHSSCYFPSCRKDAKCKCEMCLESIDATQDLKPNGSSLTILSRLPKRRAPSVVSIEPKTPPATPEHLTTTSSFSISPPVESTAKSRPKSCGSPETKKKSWALLPWKKIVLLGFFLITIVNLGFLNGLMEEIGPSLTNEILEKFEVDSRDKALDFMEILRILELKIGDIVGGEVQNCSSFKSSWEINQVDRHFFNWRCVMYESMAEQVSVWGSPLPTSGLVSTGFSSRFLIVLAGRIIEWSDGKLESTSRTANGSSWTLQRWLTVAVQIESHTWVLEYKRSALFDSPSFVSCALEWLSFKFFNMLDLAFISDAFYLHSGEDKYFLHPT